MSHFEKDPRLTHRPFIATYQGWSTARPTYIPGLCIVKMDSFRDKPYNRLHVFAPRSTDVSIEESLDWKRRTLDPHDLTVGIVNFKLPIQGREVNIYVGDNVKISLRDIERASVTIVFQSTRLADLEIEYISRYKELVKFLEEQMVKRIAQSP